MKKILIIGITGGLAQILSRLLVENDPEIEILGIDSRDISSVVKLKQLKTQRLKYSRGNFENIFRSNKFDVIYHLGRISSVKIGQDQLSQRLDFSLMGTNRILELALHHQVKKIIILSTFHVYGALADNPIFISEESPLRASVKNPELRDVVEMDQSCTSWMWHHKDQISTIVLRPCNIIGGQIQNAMTRFLLSPFALSPIDYNPHFQFIHEFDMASILKQTLNAPTGVYNIAGDDYISLREAIQTINKRGIPFPLSIAQILNSTLRKFNLDIPDYLLDYLKYSCLIDNKLMKNAFGNDAIRFSVNESLKLIKES